MRILYLHTLYAPYIRGGAETTVQTQAEGMQERGHTVAVLTIGPHKQGTTEEQVNGVLVFRAAYQNVYFHYRDDQAPLWQRILWHWRDRDNAAMEAPILEVIRQFKPDVVSCHNLAGWSIAAWRAIRSTGVPIVQVLHDQYLLCPRSTMFSRGKVCERQCTYCTLSRRQHAKASQQASAVVGVSQFILNKLKAAGYFTGVKTQTAIHNVHPGGLPPLPNKADRHARLKGKTVIGFIGTLSQHKGIELLLRCFTSLGDRSDLHLLVAGTGNHRYVEDLKRKYSASNIEFLGYVNASTFYPLLDVTVVPSIWEEPLGNIIFESFSYGVPVIGANSGGISEMIKDEYNGLLINISSNLQLKDEIENINSRILNFLPRQIIRENSIQYVDIDTLIESYLRVYGESIQSIHATTVENS